MSTVRSAPEALLAIVTAVSLTVIVSYAFPELRIVEVWNRGAKAALRTTMPLPPQPDVAGQTAGILSSRIHYQLVGRDATPVDRQATSLCKAGEEQVRCCTAALLPGIILADMGVMISGDPPRNTSAEWP